MVTLMLVILVSVVTFMCGALGYALYTLDRIERHDELYRASEDWLEDSIRNQRLRQRKFRQDYPELYGDSRDATMSTYARTIHRL